MGNEKNDNTSVKVDDSSVQKPTFPFTKGAFISTKSKIPKVPTKKIYFFNYKRNDIS